MSRLDAAIDINLARDTVFHYVSDVENQPEWNKWAKHAEATSRERRELGATDNMLMQVGPRKENVEAIVTEFRDGVLYTRRHTRGMEMTERFSFIGKGEETKVAWSVDYVPPMGPIGMVNDVLFINRLMEQLMNDSLQNLKERLESAR